MPVTIGQITSNIAKATFRVTFADEDGNEHVEEVHITYYPGRVTEKTMALAQLFSNEDGFDAILDGFRIFNEELVRLIKWWDVLENDGTTMFPLNAKRLSELSIDFRGRLMQAIIEDIRPEALASQASPLNGSH